VIKSSSLFIVTISLICFSCASKEIRENKKVADWITENIRETVSQNDADKENSLNYSLKANVLVAEELPNKKWEQLGKHSFQLYMTKSRLAERVLIGERDNSIFLNFEFPIKLRKDDIVSLELVLSSGKGEFTLSTLQFNFKGKGKYVKFSGYALFSLEFQELRE
jgi:hypothetical protein